MTLKRVDEIQMGLVAYLKSKTTITNLLYNDDADMVKEYNWKGTYTHYPCLRVRIMPPVSTVGNCNGSVFNAGIMIFSEDASSYEANYIAGIIANIMGRGFYSSGVAFAVSLTNIIPAIAQDERTWRSEILINGIAS